MPGRVRAADVEVGRLAELPVHLADVHRDAARRPHVVVVDAGGADPHEDVVRADVRDLDLLDLEGVLRLAEPLRTDELRPHLGRDLAERRCFADVVDVLGHVVAPGLASRWTLPGPVRSAVSAATSVDQAPPAVRCTDVMVQRGVRTQNSLPSGSASTTHGTSPCPMSTRRRAERDEPLDLGPRVAAGLADARRCAVGSSRPSTRPVGPDREERSAAVRRRRPTTPVAFVDDRPARRCAPERRLRRTVVRVETDRRRSVPVSSPKSCVRTQDAELVALGIGEHVPRDVALADVDACSRRDASSALDRRVAGRPATSSRRSRCIRFLSAFGSATGTKIERDVAVRSPSRSPPRAVVDHDRPAERVRPEPRERARVVRVEDDVSTAAWPRGQPSCPTSSDAARRSASPPGSAPRRSTRGRESLVREHERGERGERRLHREDHRRAGRRDVRLGPRLDADPEHARPERGHEDRDPHRSTSSAR